MTTKTRTRVHQQNNIQKTHASLLCHTPSWLNNAKASKNNFTLLILENAAAYVTATQKKMHELQVLIANHLSQSEQEVLGRIRISTSGEWTAVQKFFCTKNVTVCPFSSCLCPPKWSLAAFTACNRTHCNAKGKEWKNDDKNNGDCMEEIGVDAPPTKRAGLDEATAEVTAELREADKAPNTYWSSKSAFAKLKSLLILFRKLSKVSVCCLQQAAGLRESGRR